MSLSLLRANHLTCIREDRILFDDLCFDVNPGDLLQVEGPNGAGKTSLLRILAGLSRPYDGQVEYREQPISACREEYYQDLLYIGHLAGVKGELSAEENLDFNLKLQSDSHPTPADVLAKVRLTGFEDAPAAHLSAGQNRRIALARLWHNQAKLWILDEPFTAIDKLGVEQLERLMLQHIDQGGAVILTSHQDLQLAADRVSKLTLEYNFF